MHCDLDYAGVHGTCINTTSTAKNYRTDAHTVAIVNSARCIWLLAFFRGVGTVVTVGAREAVSLIRYSGIDRGYTQSMEEPGREACAVFPIGTEQQMIY